MYDIQFILNVQNMLTFPQQQYIRPSSGACYNVWKWDMGSEKRWARLIERTEICENDDMDDGNKEDREYRELMKKNEQWQVWQTFKSKKIRDVRDRDSYDMWRERQRKLK